MKPTVKLLSLALFGMLTLPALAQDPQVGSTTQTIRGNITGASASQSASFVVTAKIDDGDWTERLVIKGADGRLLWQSPLIKSMSDPNAFVMSNGGVSQLQVAGDVDGDGKGEVIVEERQSDVRAPRFRVLRWTGSGLVKVRSMALVETSKGSGRFAWSNNQDTQMRWIQKFVRVVSPGVCQVELGSGTGASSKPVMVKSSATGYDIRK